MIPSTLAAASDTDWAIITDLVVILVSAALVAVIMQPMRLAAIPALAAWAGSEVKLVADPDVRLTQGVRYG